MHKTFLLLPGMVLSRPWTRCRSDYAPVRQMQGEVSGYQDELLTLKQQQPASQHECASSLFVQTSSVRKFRPIHGWLQTLLLDLDCCYVSLCLLSLSSTTKTSLACPLPALPFTVSLPH